MSHQINYGADGQDEPHQDYETERGGSFTVEEEYSCTNTGFGGDDPCRN